MISAPLAPQQDPRNVGPHSMQALAIFSAAVPKKGLTQAKAAARMGIAQPDLSNILHGKFRGFAVDRLTGMLAPLDHA
jgi:predicted XRE-type DNA-binding protein